jgi:hypothetical protein
LLWQVKRGMNDFSSQFVLRFPGLPPSLAPLDGCPMFADFRVRGLNDLFPMLSPPVYTYLQEKKKEGFAHLFQPMYAKVREHGAPVPGGWAL